MRNKKILIMLGLIIITLSLGTLIYYILNNSSNNNIGKKPTEVDSIANYEYKLEDRDTKLYKDLFNQLKKELEKDQVDMKTYAELVSKLYIVDLYTINNKITKYDVGGLEFILPDKRDNYSLKVEDTLYKYVEDNSYNTRKQDLPEVSSIETISTKKEKHKVGDTEYNGYTIDLNWEYKKDYGYDTSATIHLIEDNSIIYIVEQIVQKDE